jgi:hypothetical protein
VKESTLVDKLVKHETEEMPGCVVFKHFDNVTVGMPDLSTTWAGVTMWQECKFGDDYEVSDAQERTLSRLSRAGMSYYVVFLPGQTLVCSGLQLANVLASFDKHDTRSVAKFLRQEATSVHNIRTKSVRA